MQEPRTGCIDKAKWKESISYLWLHITKWPIVVSRSVWSHIWNSWSQIIFSSNNYQQQVGSSLQPKKTLFTCSMFLEWTVVSPGALTTPFGIGPYCIACICCLQSNGTCCQQCYLNWFWFIKIQIWFDEDFGPIVHRTGKRTNKIQIGKLNSKP